MDEVLRGEKKKGERVAYRRAEKCATGWYGQISRATKVTRTTEPPQAPDG